MFARSHPVTHAFAFLFGTTVLTLVPAPLVYGSAVVFILYALIKRDQEEDAHTIKDE